MVAFDLEEIHSLSDFQRNAKQHIVRMKKKRRPLGMWRGEVKRRNTS